MMAEDHSEGIPWAKGEKDERLLKELLHLFSSNKRKKTDAQIKANLSQTLKKEWGQPIWVMHIRNLHMSFFKI